MHRLVIANTVEDRVLDLQERKVGRIISCSFPLFTHSFSETSQMAALVKAAARRLAVSIVMSLVKRH